MDSMENRITALARRLRFWGEKPTGPQVEGLGTVLHQEMVEGYRSGRNDAARQWGMATYDPIPPDLDEALRQEAQETAWQIASTYQKRLPENPTDEWRAEYADNKARQVLPYERGKARQKGMQSFYASNGDLPGKARVIPRDAATPPDICQEMIDRGWMPLEVMLSYDFPAHPACPHQWEVLPDEMITQDIGMGVSNDPSASSVEVGEMNPQVLPKKKRKKLVRRKRVTQSVVLQMDSMHRVVTGVLQTPDVPVTPSSMPEVELIYPPDTIKQMAWNFLEKLRNGQVGLGHSEVQQGKIIELGGKHATVVESYIAPQDLLIAGRAVKQGSWVLSYRINDDDTWAKVLSGQINAASLSSVDAEFEDMSEGEHA